MSEAFRVLKTIELPVYGTIEILEFLAPVLEHLEDIPHYRVQPDTAIYLRIPKDELFVNRDSSLFFKEEGCVDLRDPVRVRSFAISDQYEAVMDELDQFIPVQFPGHELHPMYNGVNDQALIRALHLLTDHPDTRTHKPAGLTVSSRQDHQWKHRLNLDFQVPGVSLEAFSYTDSMQLPRSWKRYGFKGWFRLAGERFVFTTSSHYLQDLPFFLTPEAFHNAIMQEFERHPFYKGMVSNLKVIIHDKTCVSKRV